MKSLVMQKMFMAKDRSGLSSVYGRAASDLLSKHYHIHEISSSIIYVMCSFSFAPV